MDYIIPSLGDKFKELEKKYTSLRNVMDEWVKIFNRRLLDIERLPEKMLELNDTIEHDYVKIKDLEAEVVAIRRELSCQRMTITVLRNFMHQNMNRPPANQCPDKIESGGLPPWSGGE